jgi:putative radical SAM enzyme (TIGR03279 family)
MNNKPALIRTVNPGSPAQRAGINAGEFVSALEGKIFSDYIDWIWESDDLELELEIVDPQGKLRNLILQRESLQEGWGIDFEDLVFDGIRACKNDCVFCFMAQLPATARKTLCVRDDDYRLSFLLGNFVTLTNLKKEDKERIIAQRISPLRLSFHASNAQVREQLIGKNHAKALENLDELIEAGIYFHVQIVLVPGLNDGEILEETLAYLKDAKRYEHILSVGIVPVAHTQYAPERLKALLNLEGDTPVRREEWSKSVIDQVQKHQFKEFDEREMTWVYLADEFYIHAHAPFPLPKFYDGFPQLENGIGMVLNFIEDIRDTIGELQASLNLLPVQKQAGFETATIVCGELLTQTWLGVLGGIHAGGKLRLLPVKNRYFGGNVSVTGLLTGSDILRAIKADNDYLKEKNQARLEDHRYLVPDCIFNDDGVTLDDFTAEQLQQLAEEQSLALTFYETSAQGLASEIRVHAEELSTHA